MPDTGLALGLDSSVGLRPLNDESTQVHILDATPENRDAIKKGEIVTTRQPVTPIQQPTPGKLLVFIVETAA